MLRIQTNVLVNYGVSAVSQLRRVHRMTYIHISNHTEA